MVVNRSICDNQDWNHIHQPVSTIEQTTRTLNIFVCFKTVCNIWGSLTRRTRSVASCHSKATHKEHIHRDKIRFEKASRESSVMSYSEVGGGPLAFQTTLMRTLSCVPNNTLTRSHSYIFQTEYCFYCQKKKTTCHGSTEHLVQNRVGFISVESELNAELQDSLDGGSILTLDEVEIRNNHMMQIMASHIITLHVQHSSTT